MNYSIKKKLNDVEEIKVGSIIQIILICFVVGVVVGVLL